MGQLKFLERFWETPQDSLKDTERNFGESRKKVPWGTPAEISENIPGEIVVVFPQEAMGEKTQKSLTESA